MNDESDKVQLFVTGAVTSINPVEIATGDWVVVVCDEEFTKRGRVYGNIVKVIEFPA